jgi:hypothetical protein
VRMWFFLVVNIILLGDCENETKYKTKKKMTNETKINRRKATILFENRRTKTNASNV